MLSGDIELRASQRLTDADDGGGLMSATVIQDGVENNLFPDVSEMDRVGGRVSLREVFLHIDTLDAETYYGAHAIVSENPADPNLSLLLFSAGSYAAQRAEAQDHIERYVISGHRSTLHPLGTQLEGQRQVALYQDLSAALPQIGDVFCLSVEAGEFQGRYQFIRVNTVESYEQTFYYLFGGSLLSMVRRVVLAGITQPLAADFPGTDPTPLMPGDTWCRTSSVADSARYYGTTELATAASSGALEIALASIWGRLLPSTTAEIPVTDTRIDTAVATVNAGAHSVEVGETSHTASDAVTLATRGFNYARTLRPIPAPGTLRVAYRALNRWYLLADDGSGVLRGSDSSYGIGTVNYATGTALITLGVLPDVGSAVIWSWGSAVHYTQRLGTVSAAPSLSFALGESVDPSTLVVTWLQGGVQKTATCDAGGAIGGNGCTGAVALGSGEIYLTWTTPPDSGSDVSLGYQHGGISRAVLSTDLSPTYPGTATISFTLPDAPLRPNSLTLSWVIDEPYWTTSFETVQQWWMGHFSPGEWHPETGDTLVTLEQATNTQHISRRSLLVSDDGAGNLGDLGTVNYATGAVVLKYGPDTSASTYDSYHGEWTTQTVNGSLVGPVSAVYRSVDETGAPGPVARTVPVPVKVHIRVGGSLTSDSLVPGALRFQWAGQEYRDMGDGSLQRHAIPWTTQTGTPAGSIHYRARLVTLEDYVSGSGSVSVISCLTRFGQWRATEVHARTPGSPLRPASYYVRVTADDGELLEGTCDLDGVIATDDIEGAINQEFGLADLRFGSLVLDSALTPQEKAEAWYDAADVDGTGHIWKPRQVLPDTLRVNCIALSYLPLDKDLLGVDPVRLPIDGRVPIVRTGERLVLHHPSRLTLPNPAVAGSTHHVGRTRIARVRLLDADGRRVPDSRIDTAGSDLDAGLVKLADPLDLTGYSQPLEIEHTIEDATLATSVDISGAVNVNRPLTHDFPAGTRVSSALQFGDVWSRYTNLYTQYAWTGVWSDARIGDGTTGQYDDVTYPFAMTNRGAMTGRWRIAFTSSTAFQVIGETLGVIATGTTLENCAPINPATGAPYFVIDYRGWGSGWSAGNQLRFNTLGGPPFWVVRTTHPGPATGQSDQGTLHLRGDANA